MVVWSVAVGTANVHHATLFRLILKVEIKAPVAMEHVNNLLNLLHLPVFFSSSVFNNVDFGPFYLFVALSGRDSADCGSRGANGHLQLNATCPEDLASHFCLILPTRQAKIQRVSSSQWNIDNVNLPAEFRSVPSEVSHCHVDDVNTGAHTDRERVGEKEEAEQEAVTLPLTWIQFKQTQSLSHFYLLTKEAVWLE